MTTKQQEPIGDNEFDAFEYVSGIKEKLEDIEESSNETKDTCSLLLKVFTDEDIKIKMLEERNKHLESILRYTDAIKDNERRFNNMILELKGMVSLVRSENERSRTKEALNMLAQEVKNHIDELNVRDYIYFQEWLNRVEANIKKQLDLTGYKLDVILCQNTPS